MKCVSSCKSYLGALSSEFHSTSSTSESPQKKEQWEKSEQEAKTMETEIMETAKFGGEREIKKLVLSYYGKLL